MWQVLFLLLWVNIYHYGIIHRHWIIAVFRRILTIPVLMKKRCTLWRKLSLWPYSYGKDSRDLFISFSTLGTVNRITYPVHPDGYIYGVIGSSYWSSIYSIMSRILWILVRQSFLFNFLGSPLYFQPFPLSHYLSLVYFIGYPPNIFLVPRLVTLVASSSFGYLSNRLTDFQAGVAYNYAL